MKTKEQIKSNDEKLLENPNYQIGKYDGREEAKKEILEITMKIKDGLGESMASKYRSQGIQLVIDEISEMK